MLGAAAMHREDHNGDGKYDGFVGALWFGVISSTTIGFGDAVIQTSDTGWFIVGVMFVFGGLSCFGLALDTVNDALVYLASEERALLDAAARVLQRLWRKHKQRQGAREKKSAD